MKKKIYFCLSGYINHSGMSAQTTPPPKNVNLFSILVDILRRSAFHYAYISSLTLPDGGLGI